MFIEAHDDAVGIDESRSCICRKEQTKISTAERGFRRRPRHPRLAGGCCRLPPTLGAAAQLKRGFDLRFDEVSIVR